jgi:hypothetical protein
LTTVATATLAAAVGARHWADMAILKDLSGPFHVVAEVKTFPQKLVDRRWQGPALELAKAAYLAATGKGPVRACFGCDRAWMAKRVPALFVLSELWTATGTQGLVTALCEFCASTPDLPRRIAVGRKRDLNADPATMRIIEKEGRA